MEILQYDLWEYEWQSAVSACVIPSCGKFVHSDGSVVRVDGFRKSGSTFALRFLPLKTGIWQYVIAEHEKVLSEGSLECAASDAHGLVEARADAFAYSDGTKYLPFGTTCYAWTNQPEELQDRTMKSLAESCFNKVRMLVFPKFMPYNREEPACFPFARREDGSWDVDAIVPQFWDNLDRRIRQLMELQIECDLILFHPYDKWGFSSLPQKDAMTYLTYCNARFGACRNIWWSLANEYEMLKREMADWDEYGAYLQAHDPYQHLRSVHEILVLYPDRPWLTHLSLQHGGIDLVPRWKEVYHGKPVIIDECGYEGNIEYDWGNLTAFEMVHRVWWSVCRGAYCTHGETFLAENEILWWSKGGCLHGESEPRIRFLKELLEALPGTGKAEGAVSAENPNHTEESNPDEIFFQKLVQRTPIENLFGVFGMPPKMIRGDGWCLRYYGRTCPCCSTLSLPEGRAYRAEILDIWEMTRTPVPGIYRNGQELLLPGKEGIAVLLTEQQG